MQFSFKERVILVNNLVVFPGDLTTMLIVRDLENELGFSDEEKTAANLRIENGRAIWDEGKISPKEISIGPAALDILLSIFKGMDEMKTLTLEFLPLYERFLKEKNLSALKAQDKPQKLAAV